MRGSSREKQQVPLGGPDSNVNAGRGAIDNMSFVNLRIIVLLALICVASQSFSGNALTVQGINLSQSNEKGNVVVWSESYTVGTYFFSIAYADLVSQTKAGDYVVGSSRDLVKLSPTGDLIWGKDYSPLEGHVGPVLASSDGGFLIAKSAGLYDPASVLKLDENGTILWQHGYGTGFSQQGPSLSIFSAAETPDKGFAIAGEIPGLGAFLMRIDRMGSILWTNVYGGDFACERFYSVVVSQDGGFAAAGIRCEQAWVVKLDEGGAIVWQRQYSGDSATFGVQALRVIATSDDGYLVTGSIARPFIRPWILKINGQGGILWQKDYQGICCEFSGVTETQDGGTVIVGGGMIIMLDGVGHEVWHHVFGNRSFHGTLSSIVNTKDGGFMAGGSTGSQGQGPVSAWILKLNSTGLCCDSISTMDSVIGYNSTASGLDTKATVSTEVVNVTPSDSVVANILLSFSVQCPPVIQARPDENDDILHSFNQTGF